MAKKPTMKEQIAQKDTEILELNAVIAADMQTIARLKPLVTELESKVTSLTEHSNDLQERLTVQATHQGKLEQIIEELQNAAEIRLFELEELEEKYAFFEKEVNLMHEIFNHTDGKSDRRHSIVARMMKNQQSLISKG